MKKNAPSQAKKFTRAGLIASFRLAVSVFNDEELEELRAWLGRVSYEPLTTPDEIAAAWLSIALGEIREPADAGDR
jgi:hypothetical protein